MIPGFAAPPDEASRETTLQIDLADWNAESHELRLAGKRSRRDHSVTILDVATGVPLGSATLLRRNDWVFRLTDPPTIPCRVAAVTETERVETDVDHAPSECGAPPKPNSPPTCQISAPASVLVGESVTLTGTATDPEGGTIDYNWFFGGGTDSSSFGTVPSGESFDVVTTFDVGGQAFQILLTVKDEQGLTGSCTDQILVGNPPDSGPRDPVPEQPAPGDPRTQEYTVLAFNDLGMHCADLGTFPFSVLPPFNVWNAQVIHRGTRPQIMNGATISMQYSAASNPNDPVVADPANEPPSINSTSQNFPVGSPASNALIRKTDFWDPINPGDPNSPSAAEYLFGIDHLPPDMGLPTIHNPGGIGRTMPGIADPYHANDPQPFSLFQQEFNWFKAEGIPMTPVDDFGRFNSYPLMRAQAVHNTTGEVVAAIDAVVPVSSEVDCRDCHALGQIAADTSARSLPFVAPTVPGERVSEEFAAKKNVLILHDALHNTDLSSKPTTLCAGCHNSYALEEVAPTLTGNLALLSMSAVMHGTHGQFIVDSGSGDLLRDSSHNPIKRTFLQSGEAWLFPVGPDVPMEQNCFRCHPGKITQCFRGAMFSAGMNCSNCHGDMLAVGGIFEGDFDHSGTPRRRLPWRDEPRCESCHVGDAVSPGKAAMIRQTAYDTSDPAAVPHLAENKRFAENSAPDATTGGVDLTLYRNSNGHGGVACEGCHGSPHAIWATAIPNSNDNVTANQLQGHSGTIRECTVCHLANSFPNGTLNGPHGMHPVNDPDWIKSDGGWHAEFADQRSQGDKCAPCHGVDHLGTELSETPVARVLRDAEGKVWASVPAGTKIECNLCHDFEKSFSD